jgi:hypothetical protein
MKQFSTARDYVIAAAADPSLACIPFQVAADALDVGRSAIEARVRAGKLVAIAIGRTRYVTVASVQQQLREWDNEVETITSLLEAEARRGTATLSYNPVMGAVGRKTTVPNDRKIIGHILGAISRTSFETHGFLLTAMVVRNGTARPSPAFYDLADDLDPSYQEAETNEEYHDQQIRLIQDHYAGA